MAGIYSAKKMRILNTNSPAPSEIRWLSLTKLAGLDHPAVGQDVPVGYLALTGEGLPILKLVNISQLGELSYTPTNAL